MLDKSTIATEYQQIQNQICQSLQTLDGVATFEEENWVRTGGGGGCTRVIQNGNLIEKGGVNFSAVHGKLPEAIKKSFNTQNEDFFATGISIVLHPHNPWVPIIHMNIRYFEMKNGEQDLRWFGGGIDVTPHYVINEDASNFHKHLQMVCNVHQQTFYNKFKAWADDYFYIKHRHETRGIGGIFYDRITPENTDLSWDQIFEFSKAIGNSFIPIYQNLVKQTRNLPFNTEQKQWQYQRRSRYAEFNLVYDSGTKFGLETDGRIESILMSMPPMASWVYNYQAEENSDEEQTLRLLKKGIDWVGV
ncbi:MAG: oxygen-dependent coproporphyrinogen oxidase [Sphingobacteriales bacterium]|nr:MAG: oxygen-dependent coproporphyrinogen oxidase [Sphingobacteriales bacterium]